MHPENKTIPSELTRDFFPHIFIKGEESRPTQITIFFLAGGVSRLKILLPPDIAERSIEEQFRIVKEMIRAHYAAEEGRVMFFGKIVSYLYRPSPEITLRFNTRGELVGAVPNFEEPFSSFTVGKKTLYR